MNYSEKKQTRREFLTENTKLLLGLSSIGLFFPSVVNAEGLTRKEGENYFSYFFRKFTMPGKIGSISAVRPSDLINRVTKEKYSNDYKNYFIEGSEFWVYKENKKPSFVLEDIANDNQEFMPTNNKYMNGYWDKTNYSGAKKAIKEIKNEDHRQYWETLAIRQIKPCSTNKEGWAPAILGYGFPARELRFESPSPNTYTVKYIPTIPPESAGKGGNSSGKGSKGATGGGRHSGGNGAGAR